MRLKYNVDTQVVFQIGDPIDFITAPFVHNAIYEYANLNAVCLGVVVKKGNLPEFIRACKTLNVNGFDITMPHKTDIIQYLDECDEASRAFNCVNHVKIVDGKLIGTGLDGVGMGLALQHELGDLTGKKVLVLGAGAVAGPIAADLCTRGVEKFLIVNRTVEKAKYIADTLKRLYDADASYGPMTEQFLGRAAGGIDLAIQCTSLGAAGHSDNFDSLKFVSMLPGNCVAADVLYPTTAFLEEAKKHELRTIDGQGMLLHQQIAMMEFRFGIQLPESVLLEGEEAIALGITLRDLRHARLARQDAAAI